MVLNDSLRQYTIPGIKKHNKNTKYISISHVYDYNRYEFNNSILNNEQKAFLFAKKYNPEQYQHLFCTRLQKYYN